jgi:hypothetical protein
MSTGTLTPGFQLVALKIQEAAMMHGDVRKALSDAINDHAKDKSYKHMGDSYIDHDGDGTEGNCIFSCKGDIRSAPYEISSRNGKAPEASIDFDNSKNVLPVTSYVPEAEDGEEYTSMDEAMRKDGIYLQLPLYERFIGTKARKQADASSFAGKGRSFPILKPEDVSAALHSIGRAGPGNYSSDTLRANIKRIAKSKGFALPDSLKDDDKEAKSTWKPEGTLLVESSAHFCEAPKLQEAATATYPIKLISPGRGSSGYYPPEVLKKAAEAKVFKAGTQMFWNHDTDAEESARPEGDLNRLAAVTTTDAAWNESGHDGPGLYAHAKVFSDYADKVKEMGPHIGLSIRAGGDRDESAKGPDGKPRVITALKNAASVDFVTKAGRDGKIFTESKEEGEVDMDKSEVLALIKESTAPLEAENKKLREQLMRSDGPRVIREQLADIRLPDSGKNEVIRRILSEGIPDDPKKLKEAIERVSKDVAQFLMEAGYSGGANFGARMTEAEIEQFTEKDEKKLTERFEESIGSLVDIFVGPKLSESAGQAYELRKAARKAFKKGRAA